MWSRLHPITVLAWLTFVAGLVLILGTSRITYDEPGPAPSERNWVIGRLDRSHAIGQTFTATQSELTAIRVLLFTAPNDRDDPITLRLRYADPALPDLAVVTLPLRELSHRDMSTFGFAPLRLRASPYAITTTLAFTIEAPTIAFEDGISVIAGPDTYPDGVLLHNGQAEQRADLAFQPIYRHSEIDQVLSFSSLADGKPGIFGWPPFYALLVWGYAWLMALILLQGWRALHQT